MSKEFYSNFLKEHSNQIHLSSHSHYFWPDIAKSGYEDYWQLSAKTSDQKWDTIFSKEIPKAQKHIAKILNFDTPNRISFAPNTQELTARLISSFYFQKKVNVLTTKSEFHSFSRQIKRMDELNDVNVNYIENETLNFEDNFLKSITNEVNVIFLSHVFYNSGNKVSLEFIKKIISKKHDDCLLIIDGYHAFCAIEVDLSNVIEDIYYLGGCYKYAQAGEGLCFMTTPKSCDLRPLNTGWFASFSDLEDPKELVEYSDSGFRFASSTLDFSTLFKFNRIWDHFESKDISYKDIINHSRGLQREFLKNIDLTYLVNSNLDDIGLFLCFDFKDLNLAQKIQEKLTINNILIDRRGSRIRLSFAYYIDLNDTQKAKEIFNQSIKDSIKEL